VASKRDPATKKTATKAKATSKTSASRKRK
jgi:hypothetical protein